MEFNEFEERMEKTISVFEENLSEIRAGRANPAILNSNTNKPSGRNFCARGKINCYTTMGC